MAHTTEHLDLDTTEQRPNVFAPLGWEMAQIKSAWIMVIGAGALGNEVLKNLALIGVGNILIVDFDVVEHSNLARSVLYREHDCTGEKSKTEIAAERLREMNPELNILTINGDISIDVGWGIFRRMDVIIGCVDNRLARLYINRISHRLGKTWIDGGILDLGGQMNVFQPGVSCYECQLSPKAWKIIQFRMGCVDRAMRYASAGQANTIPITSSIIGAMQVQEALKIIVSEDGTSKMADKQFYYEGLSGTYMNLPTSALKENCNSHDTIEEIIDSPLTHMSTIQETLDWASERLEDPELVIALDYMVVLELATEKSLQTYPMIKARPHLSAAEMSSFAKEPGEEVRISKKTSEVGFDFANKEEPLKSLGIPPLHILTIFSQGRKIFIELSGDQNILSKL